jgi:hypothetical protein
VGTDPDILAALRCYAAACREVGKYKAVMAMSTEECDLNFLHREGAQPLLKSSERLAAAHLEELLRLLANV